MALWEGSLRSLKRKKREASSYYSFSSFFFKNSNYTQDKEREINSFNSNIHTVPEVERVYFYSCVCRAGTGSPATK